MTGITKRPAKKTRITLKLMVDKDFKLHVKGFENGIDDPKMHEVHVDINTGKHEPEHVKQSQLAATNACKGARSELDTLIAEIEASGKAEEMKDAIAEAKKSRVATWANPIAHATKNLRAAFN